MTNWALTVGEFEAFLNNSESCAITALGVFFGAINPYQIEVSNPENPDSDKNLWNYMLHCHLILKDMQRARILYAEAIRRMEYIGPDVAFVLYSYAIFAFVMQDLDYTDVVLLLERARKAEEIRAATSGGSQAVANGTYRHGKIFDLAKIGFYKHSAVTQSDAYSWHNYAACEFLIYNNFFTHSKKWSYLDNFSPF